MSMRYLLRSIIGLCVRLGAAARRTGQAGRDGALAVVGGIQLGQLLFVAAFAVAALLMVRMRMAWPRWIGLAPAYAIGSVAMFWVLQRVAAL